MSPTLKALYKAMILQVLMVEPGAKLRHAVRMQAWRDECSINARISRAYNDYLNRLMKEVR